MAGVERFERPTRAAFESRRNPLLYHWFYTSIYPNNGCKKAPVFRLRLLKYGRGGEIRTPNTRIWNPLLCQLELHPCRYLYFKFEKTSQCEVLE